MAGRAAAESSVEQPCKVELFELYSRVVRIPNDCRCVIFHISIVLKSLQSFKTNSFLLLEFFSHLALHCPTFRSVQKNRLYASYSLEHKNCNLTDTIQISTEITFVLCFPWLRFCRRCRSLEFTIQLSSSDL